MLPYYCRIHSCLHFNFSINYNNTVKPGLIFKVIQFYFFI